MAFAVATIGRKLRWALGALVSVAMVCGFLALIALMIMVVIDRGVTTTAPIETAVRLVPGSDDTLEISSEVVNSLGVLTAPVRQAGSRDHLDLVGSLSLDPGRMVRIRSRFAGEMASIGPENSATEGKTPQTPGPLRVGHRVSKGDLLAIIWSKDIGEKKSDLVDALSEFDRDDIQLKRLQSLETGLVALKDVREAQRRLEAAAINVERAERTLRSWRLTDAEIGMARVEADKIHKGQAHDATLEQHWAEVEVRSPIDGVILERNVALGDIVTTDMDLFKIADLSTLGVMVNVFEENLPDLETLTGEARQWTVRLKSRPHEPGFNGRFEMIGKVVDPNQHTAPVMGWVENRDGHLRVGQFVTASINLPARANEIVIPKSALIEQADGAMIFVASGADAHRVERRKVSVVRRSREQVFLYAEPTPVAALAGCKPIEVGELVVTSGAVELAGALQNALSALPSVVSSDH